MLRSELSETHSQDDLSSKNQSNESSMNHKLLIHMMKIERLKLIMKFYKKYGQENNYKWALQFHKTYSDSMEEDPYIIAYNKNEGNGAVKLRGVITYSTATENYNADWYYFQESEKNAQQISDTKIRTPKYLAVINHLEQHLNKDHRDSDTPLDEDKDWDL
jgi:hypothetical protein